ncbi:MAG: hemerythrin domain-containing protein [Betaproteobacteria bacterium]
MDVMEKVRTTFASFSDGDVRGMLKADHEVILELAKELTEATSSSHRRTLVDSLKLLLVSHSRAEEKIVYVPMTKLKSSLDARLAASEGAVEHNLADILLTRLVDTQDASTDMWRAHAKVLFETLDHHIKEEEKTVFEELGEHFSADERDAMGKRFEARKNEQLAAMGE